MVQSIPLSKSKVLCESSNSGECGLKCHAKFEAQVVQDIYMVTYLLKLELWMDKFSSNWSGYMLQI